MRWTAAPILILAGILVACAAGAEEPGDGEPGSSRIEPEAAGSRDSHGSDTSPPAGQATLPSGRVVFLSLALSPAEQARGYMERKEIRPDEGLLFLFERPGVHRMWMKNCLVPIDMIWLNGRNRILAIEHAAPPCRTESCPAYGPFINSHAVLELRGGSALEEELKVGDFLQIVTDLVSP